MNNQLKYKINYMVLSNNRNVYEQVIKNNTNHLLFTDVIEINPHNIPIVYISCYYPRLQKHIDVYNRYYDSLNSICSVKNTFNNNVYILRLTKEEENEIYHLIDLWLTKFVDN